jgi:hypothetical protein
MMKQRAISNHLTYLGITNSTLNKMIQEDKKSNEMYKNNINKIPKCSKTKHRLELIKLSNLIYQHFILRFVNTLKIIIDIKTKSIKDYWKNSYERINKELDELLWTPSCNCRSTSFGFCFHKDTNGNWIQN